MTEKDRLLKTLFGDGNREHVNVKFCRGSAEVISEDALCAEVNAALFQLENGLLAPHDRIIEGFRQIDVRSLSLPG